MAHVPARIALLLADVDGTLVTHEKLLTARAIAAVAAAKKAGIGFAVTSGRPPRGMRMLFDALDITTPIAGFNGGVIVDRNLEILEARTLPDALAAEIVEMLLGRGVDVWIYTGEEWLVRDVGAPHVAREERTVGFAPKVVEALEPRLRDVVKIVGVSDDEPKLAAIEQEAQDAFGARATVARSQPYYLDITHTEANKGAVLAYLSRTLGIEPAHIATIGDQPNDVLMFRPAGLSIAMGNASDAVKKQANETTADSEHEGFALAVEHLLAAHAPGGAGTGGVEARGVETGA